MNYANSLKTQITFIPIKLSLDIGVEAEVFLNFICGSHSLTTQTGCLFQQRECNFDYQQLKIVTTMNLKKGKFQEKKAKVRVILHYKNSYKKAGKINFDISEYMNQQMQQIQDEKLLIDCPDSSATLKFQLKFKQAVLNKSKLIPDIQQKLLEPESLIKSNIIKIPNIKEVQTLDKCNNCLKLQEQIKELKSSIQSNSQRSTLSQRDSIQISKLQMLENEIKCQYQIERDLKTFIESLEQELLKQKRIVAQIMQECLQMGDSKLIELVENVIQQQQ
ncbi:unnamed protein product [Paramecium octaurelia]|uniref:C2 NT-type domain-containing protein n=1 Tax=Paramecium octaurelia TaxID=43137 RepID=A0A8S1TBE5_PAROT|nr:unnamed protein product [Paramecium octaurelia]